MRWLAPLLVLAACYEIPYSDSTRCSAADECPAGRMCMSGFCLTMAQLPDAPPPPVDAEPDAVPPPPVLTVEKDPQGSGKGAVRSVPAGIDCGEGCARATFELEGASIRLEATPEPGSMFLGWGGGCSGIRRSCELAPATDVTVTARFGAITRNLVFHTSEQVTGDFGGPAAGDELCDRLARAAGLVGFTWRALLRVGSTSARERLVRPGTSAPPRGFIRMDGLPIADQVADLFDRSQVFYPVLFDENGEEPDVRNQKRFVWTGEGSASGPAINCLDWSAGAMAVSGTGGAARGGPGELFASYGQSCAEPAPIYCVMVDHSLPTSPEPPAGALRLYVTKAELTPAGGVTAAEALCQAEKPATATTVRPLLSTTVRAAADLLTPGATYVRVDGGVIGTGAELASVGAAQAFALSLRGGIWQAGDGTYLSPFVGPTDRFWIWTGADKITSAGSAESTCADWSSASGAGVVGGVETTSLFWSSFALGCDSAAHVYCVELAN